MESILFQVTQIGCEEPLTHLTHSPAPPACPARLPARLPAHLYHVLFTSRCISSCLTFNSVKLCTAVGPGWRQPLEYGTHVWHDLTGTACPLLHPRVCDSLESRGTHRLRHPAVEGGAQNVRTNLLDEMRNDVQNLELFLNLSSSQQCWVSWLHGLASCTQWALLRIIPHIQFIPSVVNCSVSKTTYPAIFSEAGRCRQPKSLLAFN